MNFLALNFFYLYIVPFVIAGSITGFSLFFLRRVAPKVGLLDLPGGRKQHEGAIPLVGGLGLFIGFLFTCLFLPLPLSPYKPLFGCMTLILFLGLMDDLHELTPRLRLLGQILIVLMAIYWGNVELKNLGNLFFNGNIHFTSWGGVIFTVLAWLTFINACNMQDGLDGLAGTINVIQTLALLFIAIIEHFESDISLLVAFLSSLLVFLSLNFPNKKRPAKIFMGDAGSLLLGFVIAWFAIRFSQSSFSHPVTFLWITAIPLFDFFAVTIGRIRHGRSPLRSDRQHIHHILQDKGFKPPHIVIGLAFASLCLSATGIALTYSDVSDSLSFMLFLCLLIPYILAFGIFRTAAAVA